MTFELRMAHLSTNRCIYLFAGYTLRKKGYIAATNGYQTVHAYATPLVLFNHNVFCEEKVAIECSFLLPFHPQIKLPNIYFSPLITCLSIFSYSRLNHILLFPKSPALLKCLLLPKLAA